jgi:hypothetical protein
MKHKTVENIIPQLTIKDHSFDNELDWLRKILESRISGNNSFASLLPPPVNGLEDPYTQYIAGNELSPEERLVLIIALVPHIRPDFFDQVIQKNLSKAGDFPQLGGVRGRNFRGFLPTGETLLFLAAGEDLLKRFEVQKIFTQDHFFARQQVLWLEDSPVGEPSMSGKIVISQEYVDLFTLGAVTPPRFGINFPAIRVETAMEWDDLVLPVDTIEQIRDLEAWITHGKTLLNDWGMSRKLKPGYRVLFHGPPGTGKTLTASLLGKYTGKDVYKIDLSLVISKFIGETEKNLASLFDKAENKDWILFFDEADALFGKRTSVRDAHDKYANQEVSFLLQRTETYSGLVILATNFKSNIDEAFTRRFQSHIYFPPPKFNERLLLWEKSFPPGIRLHEEINLSDMARQYELTGANIMNIVQYACLQALVRNRKTILLADLVNGIKKEYSKDGKVV